MKRFLCLMFCLALVVFSGTAMAKPELAPQEVRANGGPQISLMMLNLGDLNIALRNYGYNSLSSTAVLFGGGGIGGAKMGIRIGGYGAGGEVVSLTEFNEKAVLGFGFGGCVVEYGVYVNGKTDIAVGGMLGGGGASLELTPQLVPTFVEAPAKEEYSKGFIAFEPRVNVHHQIAENIGVELIGSYMLTYDFGNKWQIGETTTAGPFHYLGGAQLGLRVTFGF